MNIYFKTNLRGDMVIVSFGKFIWDANERWKVNIAKIKYAF